MKDLVPFGRPVGSSERKRKSVDIHGEEARPFRNAFERFGMTILSETAGAGSSGVISDSLHRRGRSDFAAKGRKALSGQRFEPLHLVPRRLRLRARAGQV